MNPAALLALLAPRDLSAPLAWRAGRPISGHRFLADVEALARRLPAAGPVINLCGDRYAFAVGLGAAMVRGQASLLPPDARADTLARLADADGRIHALIDDERLETPGLERVVVTPFSADADSHDGRVSRGRTDSGSAAEGGPPSQARNGPRDAAGVPLIARGLHAVSLLTSGSTGAPQPHAKRWHTLVDDVGAAVERLAALLGRPNVAGLNLVSTVPVQHSYGLESTVLLAMLGGAAFDSGRAFFPADVAESLASVPRPRALVTTPFHLKTLLSAGVALPPVDLVLCATAPLSPQLAAQAETVFGGVLIEIYGSTETGQVASRRPTLGEVWETFRDVRVRAERASDVHLDPQASPGGPEPSPGRVDRLDRESGSGDADRSTHESERFIVEGDFVPEPTVVADVLELLDDRRFRLLGRANDLIHVAGRRSSLAHLNYHLNSIPGVRDGAFWLPDDVRDGVVRPIAFVVAPGLAAADIVAELRHRLEAVFVPRRVVQVTALPRAETGKLTVRGLREFALAQLAVDGAAVRLTLDIASSHPAYAGHFPGQPLLPGALLLSEVLQAVLRVPALAARLGDRPSLAAAKFLAPVRPGDALRLELQPEAEPGRGVRFEVHAGGRIAASGRWTSTKEPA